MTDELDRLPVVELRAALTLMGAGEPAELPVGRAAAGRAVRAIHGDADRMAALLAAAPPGAARALRVLSEDGPLAVEAVIGRGWAGRGLLPAPLDWLQRRALVVVGDDGLLRASPPAARVVPDLDGDAPAPSPDSHADGAAGSGPVQAHLALPDPAPPAQGAPAGRERRPVDIEAAASVVVAEHPEDLSRALAVPQAGLRVVAPTVAVSRLRPDALAEALRAGAVPLRADQEVQARPGAPALPTAAETAVTPWALRELFDRAVADARQLHLTYYPSSRGGAATERTVDPWRFADDLLVGWCHLRGGERTFAIDRVGSATLLASGIEHPAA